MTERKKTNSLSVRTPAKQLQVSIAKRYPEIEKKDVKSTTDNVLTRMSAYIEDGYSPAVAKLRPDGSMDVIVFEPEESKDGQKKKNRKY